MITLFKIEILEVEHMDKFLKDLKLILKGNLEL